MFLPHHSNAHSKSKPFGLSLSKPCAALRPFDKLRVSVNGYEVF